MRNIFIAFVMFLVGTVPVLLGFLATIGFLLIIHVLNDFLD